jgi:hypothetical protein
VARLVGGGEEGLWGGGSIAASPPPATPHSRVLGRSRDLSAEGSWTRGWEGSQEVAAFTGNPLLARMRQLGTKK